MIQVIIQYQPLYQGGTTKQVELNTHTHLIQYQEAFYTPLMQTHLSLMQYQDRIKKDTPLMHASKGLTAYRCGPAGISAIPD